MVYELFVDDRRPQLRLLAWRPRRRDQLRGYAEIELAIGLQISDVPVFESRGQAWAGMPSKPLTRAGRQLRDERGQHLWAPVLSWRTELMANAWARRVGELVRQQHPGDFDADTELDA